VSPREWSKHRSRIERSASKGSVVLSLDTIFNRGRPYAILRETRTAGALIYTLLSFAGVPLIEIPVFCEKHEEDCFLEFLFLKTRRKAECAAFGNNPEDLIVNAGLVVNDHIDSLAEMKFARKYPVGKSKPTQAVPDVASDFSFSGGKNIELFGERIVQAGRQIATYRTTRVTRDGKTADAYLFYANTGEQVAEFTKTNNWKVFNLITLKDNKDHTVRVSGEGTDIHEFAHYLINNFYLH
jgi:hypothetical protein